MRIERPMKKTVIGKNMITKEEEEERRNEKKYLEGEEKREDVTKK